MTPEQITALRAAIDASADQAVVDAASARNDTELTRLLNLPSSFTVWRTSVPVGEYREALVWTEVDSLTNGKARIWEWVTASMTLPLVASDPNVRAGLAEAFGAGTTTRTNLVAVGKRFATVAERVFATGAGTNGNPGNLVFEGAVTINDVGRALNGR